MGKDFTSLEIYQLSEDLVVKIYEISKDFPKEEIYGVTSQLRRAVVSISLNIAESYGRFHFKDKAQFLYNSRGSLLEVKSLVIITNRLGYLKNKDKESLIEPIESLGVKINNLIKYLKTRPKRVS
jgi:four helix bundle protein